MLYMVGFWVEYVFVRLGRGLGVFVRGVGNTVLDLIMLVLRPILIGIVTLLEDLTSPFTRIFSGIRHIHQLPDKMEEENRTGSVRAAKAEYLASGIKKYSITVWNALTYVLPAVAAAALVVIVRGGLGLRLSLIHI